MLTVLLSMLLSLSFIMGASAGDRYGYVVYRDGVATIEWHAALMGRQIRTSINQLSTIPGADMPSGIRGKRSWMGKITKGFIVRSKPRIRRRMTLL